VTDSWYDAVTRTTLLLLAAGFWLVQGAQAQLLVEHFTYNNGSLGSAGIGSSVWTDGDSANSAISVSNTAALTNSSLAGIAGSGVIFTGGTFKKKAAPFAAQSSGAVYCSFLLNIQAIGGTTKAFVYLQNGNSASSSPPLGIFLDSGSHIGIGKSVSSPAATVADALSAGTHFIVARYTFLAGSDQVDLWLDPTSLGDTNNIPVPTLTTTGGSDASALSDIFLNQAVSQTLWVDEVRVGTTWADVTPTDVPPPPPPSNPVVTQTFLTPDSIVLRGTGGAPAGVYEVLTSTDLSQSISNWSAGAAYQFDGSGHFECTNPLSPLDGQRFYSIHVGTLHTPPLITTQPQSQTVVEGQNASFHVVATGSAPLYYQWYFNTNSPLADATNAALIVSNVQSNTDAGDYSVVASNSLGSVTSSNATLTVISGGATNLFPVNGAANVCVDTPLHIAFDSAPTLGSSGQIRIYNAASPGSPVDTIDLSLSSQSKTFGGTSLHYYPVLIEGNTAFISLHSSLAYGQTYYVNIDSTVFQNVSPWTGVSGSNSWRFTTKPSAPASGTTNIIVAADGSGDFCTVQGAIDFVPSGNTTARTIQIEDGVYREIVRNNNRNNLTFLGQDRGQTIIIYANNDSFNSGSASRSMFSTTGNDITMKNLKLVNSTPQGGSQAEALKVAGLRFVFWNGELDSLQDTIMVSNGGDQAYFQDSLVQGNVDYVWGSGTVYFDNCEIRSIYRGSNPNGYITQPRNDASHNGIAFVDCELTGAGGSFNTEYLARNNSKDSNPASQTVYINCMMSTNINPVGFYLDGSSSPTNLRFWEYQSTDLTGTNLIDVSQRPSWSRQLTDSEAAAVRDLSTWFSGWVPQITP